MATLYKIRAWNENFENNRTREMKSMAWVPLPNRLDGDGYTELVDHPNGAAHFGAWVACVQVASRCGERGTLLRDGGHPHAPESLARITRLPASLFREVLPRLVSIGWLEAQEVADTEVAAIPQEPAGIPQEGAAIPQATDEERKKERKEQKEGTEPARAVSPQDAAARSLASRLGSSLNPCRKQVSALIASGWDLPRVVAAIEAHAEPGIAPWDWTKAARGGGESRRDGGLTVQQILSRAGEVQP